MAPGAVPTLGFRETLLVEETAHRRGGGGAGGRAGRGTGLSAGVGAAVPAALSRMRKKVEGRAETGPEAFTAVIIENVNASRSLLHHARFHFTLNDTRKVPSVPTCHATTLLKHLRCIFVTPVFRQ